MSSRLAGSLDVIWDFETTSIQAKQQYFPLSLFPKTHLKDVNQGSWQGVGLFQKRSIQNLSSSLSKKKMDTG